MKSLLALALVVAVIALLLYRAAHPSSGDEDESALSVNGFASVGMPDDAAPDEVFILAGSSSCNPEAPAAYDLNEGLKKAGIPTTWRGSYSKTTHDSDDVVRENAKVARTNALLAGEYPIVFVNGRGKANPTLQEVIAEYRRTHKAAKR